MTWQLYRHPLGEVLEPGATTVGSTVTVWLDLQRGLVKRQFDPDGTTVCGARPFYGATTQASLFENELKWLEHLSRSERVSALHSYSRSERYIVQEYVGPDLYLLSHRNGSLPDSLVDQMVELYHEFRRYGLFKGNGDTRNLGFRGDYLVAFDFKWARARSEGGLFQEFLSIRHFLGGLDSSLMPCLLETFSDFAGSRAYQEICSMCAADGGAG